MRRGHKDQCAILRDLVCSAGSDFAEEEVDDPFEQEQAKVVRPAAIMSVVGRGISRSGALTRCWRGGCVGEASWQSVGQMIYERALSWWTSRALVGVTDLAMFTTSRGKYLVTLPPSGKIRLRCLSSDRRSSSVSSKLGFFLPIPMALATSLGRLGVV